MQTLNFALILYLSLVLTVAASSTPNLHRRDHGDLGRLLKKRTPLDILGTQSSPQGQQTPATSPAAQSSAAAATTSSNSASIQVTSAAAAASTSASHSTTGDGLLSSLASGLLPGQSSTTSSTPTAPSSSTSSSSSNLPQTSGPASYTPANTPSQSILYLTSSSSTPSPTQTGSTSSSAGISHAAVTVLIVIAASVGAAVIVWTIIRKWKFRPSSDFEGRMQPIDWRRGANDEDAGFPGNHRPLSHASSFHSGSVNAPVDDQMRGPVVGYSTPTLNPIPDHDFTAGPAHLAPIGGYANLARGPSPQPMMQESLGRAPSINRPMQYDQHGVPLYHGYSGY